MFACVNVITHHPPRPIWLDFEVIDARCAALGATTDAERAEILHTTASSLSRWRRGVMDITLDRAARLADALGLTLADIIASRPRPQPQPRPTQPKPGPRPPAGPAKPVPPAGPKTGDAE